MVIMILCCKDQHYHRVFTSSVSTIETAAIMAFFRISMILVLLLVTVYGDKTRKNECTTNSECGEDGVCVYNERYIGKCCVESEYEKDKICERIKKGIKDGSIATKIKAADGVMIVDHFVVTESHKTHYHIILLVILSIIIINFICYGIHKYNKKIFYISKFQLDRFRKESNDDNGYLNENDLFSNYNIENQIVLNDINEGIDDIGGNNNNRDYSIEELSN